MDTSRSRPGREDDEASLRRWRLALELPLILGVGLYVWVLSPIGPGPWMEKVQVVFAILALYGFGLRLLLQSEVLKRFGGAVDEMTSANLFKFLRGNTVFAQIACSFLIVAMRPQEASGRDDSLLWRRARSVLEKLVLTLFAVLLLVYLAFFVVVIMPIAYVAYVVVSVPFQRVQNALSDRKIGMGGKEVTVKKMFSEDTAVVKSMAVAQAGVTFALILQFVAVLE